jgi:hypothetical protein
VLSLSAVALAASADTTFDFEGSNPLNSPLVGGDKSYFSATTDQARSGSKSLKFADPGPLPFESFTYDVEPTALTSGTITIWFYDARGMSAFSANPVAAKWGGAILLEDKNNPADFGAVEICELPYGGGRYYATEGSVDRQVAGDKFDSSALLPARSVGFHRVTFNVGPAESTITIDGVTTLEVGAPGGDKTLRIRIMCGSPCNGGAPAGTPGLPPGYQANWYLTAPGTSFAPPSTAPWIYYDDIAINATHPSAATATCGFEAGEYDTYAIPHPVPIPANDNPRMANFVNQWAPVTSATVAHSGANACYYAHPPYAFRSVTFDLSGMPAGSQARLWFYDARGPEALQTTFGGSIIVENGSDPSEFTDVEIWNFPYPASSDPTPGGPNYYLCPRPIPGTSSGFESRVFGNRTVGWHEVAITMENTTSSISVDGLGSGAFVGPGLNKSPRLRLMADSASSGGYANWTTVDPLQHVYFATYDPYVYYDDITIPSNPAGVRDWALFE